MFGLQNLGVVNQKNAPAIWESDVADFPANYVLGRILINSTDGSIYLDSSSSRTQIISGGIGSISFDNGIQASSPDINSLEVNLGGSMQVDTSINTDAGYLEFIAQGNGIRVNTSGSVLGIGGYGNNEFLSSEHIAGGVVVPNGKIRFRDSIGNFYDVPTQV